MYIAKMVTRYPEFKGEGYYNFLMDTDFDELDYRIQDNLHDFFHIQTIELDVTEADMMDKYPTKEDMNKEFENV